MRLCYNMIIILLSLILIGKTKDIDSLETEIHVLKSMVEDTFVLLSNTVKKAQDLNLDTRLINDKSKKATEKIQENTDVTQYQAFNNHLQNKNELIGSKLKILDDLLKSKPIAFSIEKVLEKHAKGRAKHQDFHQIFSLLEDQIINLRSTAESIYDLSYIFYSLIFFSICLILVWRNLRTAKKKHYL